MTTRLSERLGLATALLALVLAGSSCERAADPTGPDPAGPELPAKTGQDTFRLRAFGADQVFLAGSMNGWSTSDPAYELTPQGDGYTWLWATDLPAGLSQYKFVLWQDGDATWLTDPAAVEIVPDGAHYDPAYWNGVRGRTFPAPQPLPAPVQRERLVIYEININDFSGPGTFTGVQAALTSGPDLAGLGINAIELMPVTCPSYNGWGYDPILLDAVNPNFGWPSHFAALVNAAHGQGIAVILDMVLNHHAGSNPLSQLDAFSGSHDFTTTEPNPWGMVELNYASAALREHVLEACLLWIETYGVDGFRFDYIGGELYSTWIWLKNELKARHPDVLLIAEDFNYAPTNSIYAGYDAQWGGNHTDGWGGGGNNFNQVMITNLTERGFAWRGETTPTVGAFGYAYRNMWAAANVIGANDQYLGAAPGDGFSDVKYTESHDENRVVWSVDTIGSAGAQAIGGLQKAHLGALVLLTSVGIPMLYNGQEIGLGEFRPASPTIQKLDWAAGDADLRAAYRNLIRLRLSHPALMSEHTFFHWRPDLADQLEMTMVYWRGSGPDPAAAEIVVALNFDHADHVLPVPFPADGNWYRLHPVSGAHQAYAVTGGEFILNLPASTGILWLRDDGVTGIP